jgi:hypothetical protein
MSNEEQPMDHGNFMEFLEDHFGVIPMENYNAIANAIEKFCPGLTIPGLKCPTCGKPMVEFDFEDFNEQLESYAEAEDGTLPEINLNMVCINEDCPDHKTNKATYLAVFRLVEVK